MVQPKIVATQDLVAARLVHQRTWFGQTEMIQVILKTTARHRKVVSLSRHAGMSSRSASNFHNMLTRRVVGRVIHCMHSRKEKSETFLKSIFTKSIGVCRRKTRAHV